MTNDNIEIIAIVEIKNLYDQVLLRLSGGRIINLLGQQIGYTNGDSLLNLQGQILAKVKEDKVYLRDKPILKIEGTDVFNMSRQKLAIVETGSFIERCLLAAAFLVFCS